MTRPLCIFIVAAEASGDKLGAALIAALKQRLGDGVRFVGVGGDMMSEAGLTSLFPIADLSILGLIEGLAAYPRVLRRADQTADLAQREQPDIAVLIDSWGFTLRVAQRLRRLSPGLPLVKYVGPQVWASRPGRAKTLAATVDHLLTIHAFDAPYFERAGLATTFVGNSSLWRDSCSADPERLRAAIGAGPADKILLLLPGSRPGEIKRMSGVFAQTVARLVQADPKLWVVLPVASTVADLVRAEAAKWDYPPIMIEQAEQKADAFAAATVALACSGSVTTELALAGCPIVVCYRLGALTHFILRRLITTPYITLFNIAAGREVAPEFVQNACMPEALAKAVADRLNNAELRAQQIIEQYAALDLMGRKDIGDPAERAADAVIKLLMERGRL
jgi:lipid-A-disaccharide synthase